MVSTVKFDTPIPLSWIIILWMVSSRKFDPPSRVFMLDGCRCFRWFLFVCLVDAVFRNDFIPKNYTPYPIIGNVSGN